MTNKEQELLEVLKRFVSCTDLNERTGKVTIDTQEHIDAYQEAKKLVGYEESYLMKQYRKIKAKYPDALLLFSTNGFYQAYNGDAKKLGEVCGMTVAEKKHNGKVIYISGFGRNMIDVYMPKLVKAGLKVALCDQLSSTN